MTHDVANTAAIEAPVSSGAPETTTNAVPWWVVVTLLTAIGAVLPLLIAAHFGVLDRPRGDDVSYLYGAFRFAEDGVLDGSNWGSMSLIGQLVAAAPLVGHLRTEHRSAANRRRRHGRGRPAGGL